MSANYQAAYTQRSENTKVEEQPVLQGPNKHRPKTGTSSQDLAYIPHHPIRRPIILPQRRHDFLRLLAGQFGIGRRHGLAVHDVCVAEGSAVDGGVVRHCKNSFTSSIAELSLDLLWRLLHSLLVLVAYVQLLRHFIFGTCDDGEGREFGEMDHVTPCTEAVLLHVMTRRSARRVSFREAG